MIKKTTKTIYKEYDSEGKLIKHTETTVTEEEITHSQYMDLTPSSTPSIMLCNDTTTR